MTIWDIEIHSVATARTPGPEVFFQRAFGEWVDIAVHVFVLRSKEGCILIDAGFGGPLDKLNAKMRVKKGSEAGFNLMIEDVWTQIDCTPDLVALTSFGQYTAGGVAGMPAQPNLIVSARGLADLERAEEPALIHPLSPEVTTALLTRSNAVHRKSEIAPGVVFHEVGVHHPASAAVEVTTSDGQLIIADPVFTARNLTDWIALGAAENAGGWYRMVRQLARDGARFLPIHDPAPQPVALDINYTKDFQRSKEGQ